ncbi:hypothetical protein [Halorubrum sp. 2020YC2]|uniref:hypothetical protein n=1 Tax=Halorubrum sp. 2020YC2 TaxID=2836432 RepID=UPI001BE8A658|nr:hypothetical protein [Halorubrum sp. 2020YC2]QWC19066.1 hypothetical protein KI388_13240 [Halorubrum sp. 2020YC2]
MRRLTRSELASRVGPRPPADAFWRRAIDRGEAALGVGADAVGDSGETNGQPAEPLDTGDIVDVGDHAFVVVDAEWTEAGGRVYRIELVADRDGD